MGKRIHDWSKIQQYYNNSGCSTRDLFIVFGVTQRGVQRAVERGEFKRRSMSEARRLAAKTKPQTLSVATRKKISSARIKYLKEHPDRVPYLLNHYSKGDSYPERYFEKLFAIQSIKLEKKVQMGLYQLDFCDRQRKIDLEIDGEQHYLDVRIAESDKRRTEWLEAKGWVVMRIRWSDYKKMTKQNRINTIEQLKRLIASR